MQSQYIESARMPKNASIKTYRKHKIKILSRDFCIRLTDEEIERINNLETEIAIDQCCLGIINKRWG